jgi:Glycosyl hydrolases family 18
MSLRALPAALLLLLCSSAQIPPLPLPMAMPWLCLEVCGDSAKQIAADVAQVVNNAAIFNVVAFESFNLGANSTLIKNNLTNVVPQLKAAGIITLAQVSSFPYPPIFLTWMRDLFANPQPFFDACIAAAKEEGFDGFNIDWEPPSSDKPTAADAAAYASFLDALARTLHASGLYATVDVATWSKIWDLKLIGATALDAVFTMNTYTAGDALWEQELADDLASVPLSKLVVGLETTRDGNKPYNQSDLSLRFDAIKRAGVRSVGLWASPIPDSFLPFLAAL